MDASELRRMLLSAAAPGPPRLRVLGDPGEPAVVGLVSGSFDPMTMAHAALAAALREGAGADAVLFAYSPRTLPKEGGEVPPPLLTPERRLASVSAYCERRPELFPAVCSHGLYADQAEAAARAFPGAEIVLGVGSDKVLQLFDPKWYEDPGAALDRLFRLARVAYGVRAGDEDRVAEVVTGSRWRDRLAPVALPPALAGLSSGAVRTRVRAGEEVAGEVPPEVLPFLPGLTPEEGGG